jgi:hypothetical protein
VPVGAGLPLTINYAAERVTVATAQLAGWRGSATRAAMDLAGPCPACGHQTQSEIPRLVSALESFAPAPAPPPTLTAGLRCACRERHQGRPDAESAGCGRDWLVRTTIGADGTVAFAPVPGPPDPRLEEARVALRAAAATQLTDVRAAAEKWIAGVTAVFSLFGLAGITFTRSAVAGLVTWGQACAGGTAAVAVAAAGWSVYWIYRAAYGWPVTSDVSSDEAVLRWYAARQAAPAAQAELLRNGVRAAGGALALLVVTTGLLWFAPQAAPPGPLVRATLSGGSQVCGTLLPSQAAGTTVVRRASDGTAVSVPARSLVSLAAAAACPG